MYRRNYRELIRWITAVLALTMTLVPAAAFAAEGDGGAAGTGQQAEEQTGGNEADTQTQTNSEKLADLETRINALDERISTNGEGSAVNRVELRLVQEELSRLKSKDASALTDTDISELDSRVTALEQSLDNSSGGTGDSGSTDTIVTPEAKTDTISASGTYTNTIDESVSSYTLNVTLPEAGRLKVIYAASGEEPVERVNYSFYSGADHSGRRIDTALITKSRAEYTYDLTGGDYSVYIDRIGTHYGGFTVTTEFTAAGETYTGDNDSVNKVRNSSPVPFGTQIKGFLAVDDQSDYFRVDLPHSGRLTIAVHTDITIMDGYIYTADDSAVLTTLTGGKGSIYEGDQTFTFDLTAGTYFLEFERYSSSYTGAYNFTVSYKSAGETYETENNSINAVRAGAAASRNTLIKGQIALNDEYDYFKFKVTSAGTYYLKVSSSIGRLRVRMYTSGDKLVSAEGSNPVYHEKGSRRYTYKLKKGTYYICFQRYSRAHTGNYSFSFAKKGAKVSSGVSRTKITSIKAGKGSFTVKWKKKSGSGYQVQYALNKKFTKGAKKVTVRGSSKVKKTVRKLKKGRTYYVRVRTYKSTSSGREYSGWSKIRKVKVK